ncbi:MAG: XkdF-like putative serine protease domain-containing protein [Chlamydiota bacterium]
MKARRFLDVDVEWISLVFDPREPANREPLKVARTTGQAVEQGLELVSVARDADFDESKATFDRIVPVERIDKDARTLYGIVYRVNDVDACGTYATAETVHLMMRKFAARGLLGNVDSNHDEKKLRGVFISQQWIVKRGDPLFPEPKYEGAWAAGAYVQENDAGAKVWERVEKGEARGFSLKGMALVSDEHEVGFEPVANTKKENEKMDKKDQRTDDGAQPSVEEISRARKVLRWLFGESAQRGVLGGQEPHAGEAPADAVLGAAARGIEVELAGREFSKCNLDQMKAAHDMLGKLIAKAGGGESEGGDATKRTTKQEGKDMEKSEVVQLIAEAMKPIEAKLTEIGSKLAEKAPEVKLSEADVARIAAVETKLTAIEAKQAEAPKTAEQQQAELTAKIAEGEAKTVELTKQLREQSDKIVEQRTMLDKLSGKRPESRSAQPGGAGPSDAPKLQLKVRDGAPKGCVI